MKYFLEPQEDNHFAIGNYVSDCAVGYVALRGARSSMNVIAASLSRPPTYQDATSFMSASRPTHVQISPAPSGAAFAGAGSSVRADPTGSVEQTILFS